MTELRFSLILASNSPRRKHLLHEAGFNFEVIAREVDEGFSENVSPYNVPVQLAERKSDAVLADTGPAIVVTADTVVILDNKIINKPANEADATAMLKKLSGRMHEVVTGVCIAQGSERVSFSDLSKVYFRELEEGEISYYVRKYKPLDKAGAYGIQEWIGYIGVQKIEGSYFNIMGLPIDKVYLALKKYAGPS